MTRFLRLGVFWTMAVVLAGAASGATRERDPRFPPNLRHGWLCEGHGRATRGASGDVSVRGRVTAGRAQAAASARKACADAGVASGCLIRCRTV